ncbi:aldehyde dehydrogenase family protein [Crossiella sp. CA-258035]|uniref:aldehyde dehydrogenase family protein n=1 Tax=Crossiella sp. CA-258035 TaxID=2981138 RepID=UPI0024BC994A|nr:aldehyde dehydrogenase family protein [Crossiella sp. CA-258035]WHT15928.1 aldehyde dehydrogenase family protein [Crossiella sp. CA-258035]
MTPPQLSIHSPLDGSLVGTLPAADPQQVAEAVAAARTAQHAWARTSPAERGAALHTAAAALRARAEDLAAVQRAETGRPLEQALGGIEAGAATLVQYAELGPLRGGRTLLGQWGATDFTVPEPRGVLLALTPWNDPVAVACGLLGAGLATGNAVLHKPSERCPHSGALLGDILADCLPAGVLTTVVGDATTGAALVRAGVDVIAHVGGTAAGRVIAREAAATGAKVLLENGGNDALIVDRDVDPAWAAEQAAIGAFTNQGQICTSVERIYLHRDLANRFHDELVKQAQNWPGEQPLVDRRHREHVHSHVSEAVNAGATLLTGGELPEGPGAFYPATVLTGCADELAVLTEETFGPVAPIRVVSSFTEAVRLAAGDRYGLAATVLTADMANAQLAWRELPVGTVKVNAVFGGAPGGAAQPRGASGDGFGYGPELLDELVTMKVVHTEPARLG